MVLFGLVVELVSRPHGLVDFAARGLEQAERLLGGALERLNLVDFLLELLQHCFHFVVL